MNGHARLALAAALTLGLIAPVRAEGTARDAARAERFDRAHGTVSPAPVSTRVELATALFALSEVSRSFDQSGNGDAEYWMKTTRDFVRTGRGLGSGLHSLSHSMNPGPLAAAIGGVGAGLSALSEAGNGDAHYWMGRTRDTAQRIKGAGQQLDTIAASLAASPAPETVPAGAVLMALAQVASTLEYAGHGDAEYWMRTTRNFVRVGRGVGRGLALVAGSVPSPLNAVLSASAVQLTNLSEAGNGTADYWMARARGVAEQVRGHGQSLHDIALNLP